MTRVGDCLSLGLQVLCSFARASAASLGKKIGNAISNEWNSIKTNHAIVSNYLKSDASFGDHLEFCALNLSGSGLLAHARVLEKARVLNK